RRAGTGGLAAPAGRAATDRRARRRRHRRRARGLPEPGPGLRPGVAPRQGPPALDAPDQPGRPRPDLRGDGGRGGAGPPHPDRSTVQSLGPRADAPARDQQQRRPGAEARLLSKQRRLFGTDGIRGRFGAAPLDRATVTALAVHLAATLRERSPGGVPLVVLGGDTRESTPALCRWLAAGLTAGGAAVRFAGVIPTPGVARLTRELQAAAGVVVSASHNPYPDNGIKLLDAQGFKWSEADEAALERHLESGTTESPTGDDSGEMKEDPGLRESYLLHMARTVPGEAPLAGLKIVLDTGNGAASSSAGELFTRLGAAVTLLHAAPDGRNVNAGCGSTAPEEIAARVA